MHTSLHRFLVVLLGLALIASACGEDAGVASSTTGCLDDPGLEAVVAGDETLSGTSLVLQTHGSFLISDTTLDAFTAQTGIEVEVVQGADAGALVSEAVLTKDNPTADVLFGIDNAFLCRGLDAGLFTPYESPGLAQVDDTLELDPHHRVTPDQLR